MFNNAVTAHRERAAIVGALASADPYAAEVCLEPSDVPIDVVRDLGLLEPCGLGNPLPRMALLGARVVKAGLVRGGHLQVRLVVGSHSIIYGFGYGLGAKVKELPPDCHVNVVGWLRKDTYRGGSSVGLRVDTIEPA
jgi:single-stranded-DNA-specific exonuclease